jgi:hypothetical protein
MPEIDSLAPSAISPCASREAERRARDEEIDRRLASMREQMAILDEIIGEWRAQGILPPEEPRRRV